MAINKNINWIFKLYEEFTYQMSDLIISNLAVLIAIKNATVEKINEDSEN